MRNAGCPGARAERRRQEDCTWCFTPEGMATGDVNLAQKIALENFENQALRIANQSSASTWFSRATASWMRWR
jgi:hypothetical protein